MFCRPRLRVAEDILEHVKQGVPAGQNTDSARLGHDVPEIAVVNAPYCVTSIEELNRDDLTGLSRLGEALFLDQLIGKMGIPVLPEL